MEAKGVVVKGASVRAAILGFISVLALAVLGAGFWWFNAEILAPGRAAAQEAEQQDLLPPPEEPGIGAWRHLAESAGSRAPEENVRVIREFLAAYPESTAAAAARESLTNSAASLLFTDLPAPWKTSYTVVSGDSLARISSREKSPMEWIMKVNNLLTHNLQIGQILLLPRLEVRIVVDREAARLDVFEQDGLLLSYPMLDSGSAAASGETTVRERIVSSEGNRLAFGDPRYADGEKTIALASGTIIGAMPAAAPGGETPAMQRGLLLEPADFQELFLIVRPGTPVEIQ